MTVRGFLFSPQVASYVTRHRSSAPTDAKGNRLFEDYTTSSLREALRLLLYAHRLILEPKHWTKEAWARNRKGGPVPVDHKQAFSWCVSGAVVRAQSDLYGAIELLKVAKEEEESEEIVAFVGPKRVAVALELIGRCLVMANWNLIDREPGSKKAGQKTKGSAPHWTVLASIVNDMPRIEHPHVLLGLAVAIDAVHEELYARSRRSSGRLEASDET
jgi:hypothetical protein